MPEKGYDLGNPTWKNNNFVKIEDNNKRAFFA